MGGTAAQESACPVPHPRQIRRGAYQDEPTAYITPKRKRRRGRETGTGAVEGTEPRHVPPPSMDLLPVFACLRRTPHARTRHASRNRFPSQGLGARHRFFSLRGKQNERPRGKATSGAFGRGRRGRGINRGICRGSAVSFMRPGRDGASPRAAVHAKRDTLTGRTRRRALESRFSF